MIYEINLCETEVQLEPVKSEDFGTIGKKEKDLENLLADKLSVIFSENNALMPIFQERQWKEEPDLVAMDQDGNLVIFELKRGKVLGDATIQVMRYSQNYHAKPYAKLNAEYQDYLAKMGKEISELKKDHQEAFALDNPLDESCFNQKHKLVVVGSYADYELIKAVDYWKKSIDIDFIPYRLYKIGGKQYFEFFSKPYDTHEEVGGTKGIIFDTNRTYEGDVIWDMLAQSKISAYGDKMKLVESFNKGDYVFYYHKGWGIVAAGTIKSSKSKPNGSYELYREVKLLTTAASKEEELRYISAGELKKILGKGFYFANTTKRPYLTKEESEKLLTVLQEKYSG